MIMNKYCLLYIWLFTLMGVATAQATVSTSQEIAPAPVQSVKPSTNVPRNPFSGSKTTATMAARTLVLSENQLLSQGIKSWVVGNGYKLYWNSKKDYLIYNTISLSGRTDDEILQALGDLFASENYGLIVKKYEKNHVIVIDEM